MADLFTLRIDKGTTVRWMFDYADNSGVPINLTGATAVATFQRSREASSAIELQLSTPSSGLSIPSPTTGRIEMVISAVQTAALSGNYEWMLQLTLGGDVIRLCEGMAYANP